MDSTRRSFTTGTLAASLGLIDWRHALAQGISLQDLGKQIGPLPKAVIYVAREVLTMDPARARAEAVAVVGDRIAAVGSLAELQALAGPQPFRIDRTFADKVVLPGFVEQHVHPVLSALMVVANVIAIEDWDTVAGFSPAVRDPSGYRQRLVAALKGHGNPDEVFLTWGYHHYFHGEMSRALLDQLAPDFPVIVWHRSQHEVFLNTKTMQRMGVDDAFKATFTPSQAAMADFDKGHFFEQGTLKVLEKIAPAMATPDLLRRGLEFTVDYYHRQGITTACEPGGFYSKPLQDAINAVYAPESTPFNHYFIPDGKSFAALFPKDPIAMVAEARKTMTWGSGRARFLPQQIKLLTDGAIYSQLMQMRDGYTDGHKGAWIMDPDVFTMAFQTFWDQGYQIHVHNNGDAGMDVLLANVEHGQRRKPRFDHRTTIVHFGFARPEQIERAGRLGCIVSANPYYVTALSGRYAEVGIGPERARRMVPLGDAAKAKMSISFHSDMPMAPAKPLQLMWSAVNRLTAEGPVSGPDQKVDLDTALRAMTIDAAYSIRLEHEVGSITPGKYANFTILEQSPYAVAPTALKDIPVWGTVLEGRVQKAPDAPVKRTEAPSDRTRFSGFSNPTVSRFAALDASIATPSICDHAFCVHTGADAAIGCACGGAAFSAAIDAMLSRG
jgi:predicted amidohydrolase YtcJ